MIESLKHTIYAGLGAAVLTAETVEKSLQDLVEKGKLSADEARDTARKISEESKKEYKDARSSLEKTFEEMLSKAPLATNKDVAALNKRLDSIEKAIADLKPSDS